MRRLSFIIAIIFSAGLTLSGCGPAYQYEPLTLTSLELGQSRSINIVGTGGWRDTGIEVHRNEVYRTATQGTWSAGALCGAVDAAGMPVEHLLCMKAIFAQNFPVPNGKIMALVGKIGPNGKPFVIGGSQGFIADADGTLFLRSNDPDDFLWDNTGQVEVAVQRYEEGVGDISFQAGRERGSAVVAPRQAQARRADRTTTHTPKRYGTGYYGAEQDISFNVLESVTFDSVTGELAIAGRFDPKYAGPRIPYLQHLAVFLENPGPQVSLDWTPEFERRVDAFFRRMDDDREMGNLVGGGQLLDDAMNVTRKGKLFLPMFGVKPFDHGNAPGSLGAGVSFVDVGVLRVNSVQAGSAADRAGLSVGDEINMVTTADGTILQPYIPATLVRIARFAGAGAKLKLSVGGYGPASEVEVTLDAFTGDDWAHVTKYDILERIFLAADKPKAAYVLSAVGGLLRNGENQAGEISFINLLVSTDAMNLFDENRQRVQRGEIDRQSAMREVARKMVRGMETNMGLSYNSIVPIYDREYARTGDPFGPIDVAILELNRLAEPIMKDALKTALYKNDQITMPVSVLDESANFQPTVKPRYISIPSDSELARLFIEADYVAKAIVHQPDLSERVPGYKTDYAYSGDRPGRVEETTNRLWMEPSRVQVHRSTDNSTLRFGRTDMRINIGRAIGGGAERRDEGYGRLLTSIYDDLAAEFYQLHELREAAKLAVVARWIKSVSPGFRLPQDGRARLSPPATLEGFVTLIWSPHRIKVSLIAPGGIDFNVPPIGPSGPVFPEGRRPNLPMDASVVDMRDVAANDMPKVDPQLFSPTAATSIPARYRRPLTEPPVPASARLVVLATKGLRTQRRIDGLTTQTKADPGRCDADKSRALRDKLSQAASTARKLQGVENALNAITSQLSERQRTFDRVDKTLREEEQRLREGAMDLATNGLLGAYDEIKGSSQLRSIKDLETLIATMRDAKKKLGDISDKLSNLDLAISSAMARSLNEREQATKGLLVYLKDTLGEGAKLKGTDATSRALRTAGKTIGVANKLQTAIDGAESIYKIADAVETLKRLDTQSEMEVKGLRDSLLPLHRKLSDQLDDQMNDPLVRALDAGTGRFDCRP